MAKATGILIDPRTGDLQVSAARDALGLRAEGFAAGDATAQHASAILEAAMGEFKEYPTLGAGIAELVCDIPQAGWAREITRQLEADGMRVDAVKTDPATHKLTIDAHYDS